MLRDADSLPPHTPLETGGRIEVICGCMFSGKTTRLIEQLRGAEAGGQRVVAFKHTIDDRYAPDQLVTHGDERYVAVAVSRAGEIPHRCGDAAVVGIDEGHFFGGALVCICVELARRGVRVIVAGLHHDAWGQPFPPFPELCRIADYVEVLSVPCTVCGRPSEYSQRLTPVTDPRMIGGLGDYEPRCAACFRPLSAPAPDYTSRSIGDP